MRRLAFLFCIFFCAVGAVAEISGDRDPAFRTVLTQWLGGQDDLAALHGFAALASDGNVAAQVTLGLISNGGRSKARKRSPP